MFTHADIQYVCTYRHTCIHTDMHASTQAYKHTSIQSCRHTHASMQGHVPANEILQAPFQGGSPSEGCVPLQSAKSLWTSICNMQSTPGNAVHLEKRVPHACWIFGIPFPSLGPKGSTQRQSDNFKRSWFVHQHAHACILCADLSWQKLRDARK